MSEATKNPGKAAAKNSLQLQVVVGIGKAYRGHPAERNSNSGKAAKSHAAALRAAIRRLPQGSIVYVTKADASLFRSPPVDGRIYVVEDPLRKNVCHWTFPGGGYECWDLSGPLTGQPDPLLKNLKKKIRGKKSNRAKQSRLAEVYTKGKTIRAQSDESPEVSLIDLHRVIRIVGFNKSFIYDRKDFPKPVQLGASQRSAVRWVEGEVVEWVNNLTAKRDPQVG